MIRSSLGFCGALAIAACAPPEPSKSVSLAAGEILAIAPSGYCVDKMASQPRRDFAVLAPCATLGSEQNPPDIVGIATIQIGPADSGVIAQDEAALRDFLTTEAGASLLSQTGSARDVTILSTQAFSDQVMVHFSDAGVPNVAGLQNKEWRAFRDLNGRLVTVSLRGLAVAPLQDGPGAGLLKLILAGVSSATQQAGQDMPDA